MSNRATKSCAEHGAPPALLVIGAMPQKSTFIQSEGGVVLRLSLTSALFIRAEPVSEDARTARAFYKERLYVTPAQERWVRLSSLTRARTRFSQYGKRPSAHDAFTIARLISVPLCQPGKADVLYVRLSRLTQRHGTGSSQVNASCADGRLP